jgi:hypothetical protein
MGLSVPYRNFSVTEGICSICKQEGRFKGNGTFGPLEEKATFFRDLRVRAMRGEILELGEILEQARQLGVSPSSLIMGSLQPILGMLVDHGDSASTCDKDHIAALSERILVQFEKELPSVKTSHPAQVVFAVTGPDDFTLAIRTLALILRMEGIIARCVVPNISVAQLIEICKEVRPKVLGISLSSEDDNPYLEQVLSSLTDIRPNLVTVGGLWVAEEKVQLDPSIYMVNPRDFEQLVDRIKAACAP